MSLSIQTNTAALNAHRALENSQAAMEKSMQRLSSGYRINNAADDAAGLSISEGLQSQVGGLQQAQSNANDAISLVQTSDGALSSVQSMLQRVRDLAVQYTNGTLSDSDKAAITAEVSQICAEISDIATQTSFNGISLMSGGATITFQVGANDGQTLTADAVKLFGTNDSSHTYDVNSAIFDLSSSTVLASIDEAISNVSSDRANLGAVQNRLTDTVSNLSTYQQNLTASESQIKDVDMASEMTNYTQEQVLQQAGTAMLAQANALPQSILTLLKG